MVELIRYDTAAMSRAGAVDLVDALLVWIRERTPQVQYPHALKYRTIRERIQYCRREAEQHGGYEELLAMIPPVDSTCSRHVAAPQSRWTQFCQLHLSPITQAAKALRKRRREEMAEGAGVAKRKRKGAEVAALEGKCESSKLMDATSTPEFLTAVRDDLQRIFLRLSSK